MHSRHEKLKELQQKHELTDSDKEYIVNSAREFGKITNPKDVMGSMKPPLSLLTPAFLEGAARAMEYGAFKAKRKDGKLGYGAYNWRTVKVRLSIYTDAILRHAVALADGEDLDKDSGLPHADHIAANINVIQDANKYGTLEDDRLNKRGK